MIVSNTIVPNLSGLYKVWAIFSLHEQKITLICTNFPNYA